MITPEEFVKHVQEMRDNQKAYFKAPWSGLEKEQYLQKSKDAEKQVDDDLKWFANPQATLFS